MMGKIMIVYASMSGNTEAIADYIAEGIESEGLQVDKKEVLDVSAAEMNDYDAVILGAYTWGDGELPDEFLDFYDELAADIDLSGKNCAAFGSGDTSYEHFCAAVDILEAMMEEKGGKIVLNGLKIELAPEGSDIDLCKEFGVSFAKAVKGEKIQR
jgi:flavodoxin I